MIHDRDSSFATLQYFCGMLCHVLFLPPGGKKSGIIGLKDLLILDSKFRKYVMRSS